MTLVPDSMKKTTEANFYMSRAERKAVTDLIDKVRDRLIFDINNEREKIAGGINKRAIQGAPDESGASDPIMYIKLDNFLKELRDAIGTEAVIADITMRPNEISNATGDLANNRTYSKSMNTLREALDSMIVQRKDKSLSNLFGTSDFQIKQVYNLGLIEDLTAGRRMEELLAKGKIVPEYGITKVPAPASKRFYEPGSYPYLINQAYEIVIEDQSESGLTQNLQMPIRIDRKQWKKLMDFKKGIAISGTSPTTLSAYKDITGLKPKTKLDILQMAVAQAVAQNEGIMGPRPILPPQINELIDPDTGQPRKYYMFTIGGYSGARVGAKTLELPEDIAGIPEV
jgi:hypothetical protein